eukprot:TRINITY_DN1310_c0_g5_i1.p1 TRINITY_DN1310_c0_g5~~TRINITY_DN1310_c0_g5_i1.p1  ORF type:complete len:768 (+),score=182.27 TRINITY_DN1310_c0_g5_i1:50-2353(+)
MTLPESEKYKQGCSLGKGSFGTVYKVTRKVDGTQLAMKVQTAITKEEHDRQEKEVLHMLKLNHSNVVPCLDYFVARKEKMWKLHIVMPLYHGDLEKYIRETGLLGSEKARNLLTDVSEALRYLHKEKGYIHRDVKPANIMVSHDATTFVLADFGLSKDVATSDAYTIAGTPVFMAPDYGDLPYTDKVDIWALGVTACCSILEGEDRELLLKYLRVNHALVIENLGPALQRAVGAPLDEVLPRLLSWDPCDRPTAEELLQIWKTQSVHLLLRAEVGGIERTKKIVVSQGATLSEVGAAAAEAFKGEVGQTRWVEVYDEDFGEYIEANDTTKFMDKGRVRAVFEAAATREENNDEKRCDPNKSEDELRSFYTKKEFLASYGTEKGTEAWVCAGEVALRNAAREGNIDEMRHLILKCNVDPDARDKDGTSALHCAVYGGQTTALKILIDELKQCPKVKKHNNSTLLHAAAAYDNLELVRYLVDECGLDPDLRGFNNTSPLCIATRCGKVETMKLLIDKYKQDPSQAVYAGFSLLHCAAYGGHTEALMLLVDVYKQDLGKVKDDGKTVLHTAMSAGVNVMQLLIDEYKQDPAITSQGGWTILHAAAIQGNCEAVRLLINKYKQNPLVRKHDGGTLLHAAAHYDQVEMMKLLIEEFKVQPWIKGQNESTPLHSACLSGKLDIVKLLIEDYHQDPAAKRVDGWMAIHCAASNGRLDVVQYLLSVYDANAYTKTSKGSTPYGLARNGNHEAVAEILKPKTEDEKKEETLKDSKE